MSAVDIVLIVVIAAALTAAAVSCIRKKGGCSCGCCSGSCPHCAHRGKR